MSLLPVNNGKNRGRKIRVDEGPSGVTPVLKLLPLSTVRSTGKLHTKGVITGFKRGLRKQTESTSLIKLDGVFNKEDAQYYVGKRAVYIYKAKKTTAPPGKKHSRVRAIWGKLTRVHGNSGIVRAKFSRNLPPKAMGHRIRVMLYPSNI